ncbi:MAG TPA: DUF4430 domain-containing protein [Solirubrobacteraceae bacterium]|jgi:hypothetical protein
MQRTHRARSAPAFLAAAAALGATFALSAGASSAAPSAKPITVRVEGTTKTLLASTAVALSSAAVVKDGKSADSCPGTTAAGALEVATHGNWRGTWSASYHSYFLTGIEGQSFPSTGATYWAFWVNDVPSSAGICSYHPKPGDSILFFPDCYGKKCPKSAGVLGVKAAATATVGQPFTLAVTAYGDAKGTPSDAAGANVAGGGASATTAASGAAKLTFAHSGHFTLKVSKPHAVRTEVSVCVQSAGASTCG